MSREVLLRTAGDKALYRQIAEHLDLEIRNKYKNGEFLPSEGDMAERFGVNRHTLRKAIDELAIRGLVHRQHGRRIVVNGHPVQYAIHSGVQFSKNMEALGADWNSEVVEFDFIEAPEEICAAMSAEPGHMVFMQTLCHINHTPACITTHYLAPQCRESLALYESGSLHDYLQESCAIRLRRGSCHVSAALMDATSANYLQMPPGAPLLCIDSIHFNRASGEAIEFSRSFFRGDLIKLNVEIHQDGEAHEPR